MIEKTLDPKLEKRIEDTITLLEEKFHIGLISQAMIREMCKTIYLDGINKGLQMTTMILDGKITREGLEAMQKEL